MEEEKKLHFIAYNAEDARGEAALAVSEGGEEGEIKDQMGEIFLLAED